MKILSKISYVCLGLAVIAGCSKDSPSPVISSSSPAGTSAAGSSESGAGKSGSTALFTIAGNYLYVVNNSASIADLSVYDIAAPESPALKSTVKLTQGVETIFSTKENLFIGTQTGVLIYSLGNPENPGMISNYRHMTSCDPVVVNGEYAYLTLRGGTDCRRTQINTLEVLSIQNISNPHLVTSTDLSSPYGLGVDGNTVFVCDGKQGLKVFEHKSQSGYYSHDLTPISTVSNITCYDLIAGNDLLIVTGEDGVYQYDYKDIHKLNLLSTIPVAR